MGIFYCTIEHEHVPPCYGTCEWTPLKPLEDAPCPSCSRFLTKIDGPFGYKETIKKLTESVYEWERGQIELGKENAILRTKLGKLRVEAKRLRRSLESAHFTDEGGELWKPPIRHRAGVKG